ncbi:MAG: iron-sulfur cluster repair di-iron protein [Deltaproteobacteria bacterium]|nr:MAG: iron-sulfur cluster repair di-iron protein [Deltaproteobacteria bacterium]
MNPIDSSHPVARIALRYPGAARVFMRRDIDFCCGGSRPLVQACEAGGHDVDAVLAEIAAERPQDADVDAGAMSTAELVDHIVSRFHRPLPDELTRLLGLAVKVRQVHGPKAGERLQALVEFLADLHRELLRHMRDEESVVFPALLGGYPQAVGAKLGALTDEHTDLATRLERLRGLTDRFTPPAAACTTWRVLYDGLAQLDADLRLHVHLENNVLFARVAR